MADAHVYYLDRDVVNLIFGTLFKNTTQDELHKVCANYYGWDVNDEDNYDLEEFIITDIQTLEGIKKLDKKGPLKGFNYGKLQ